MAFLPATEKRVVVMTTIRELAKQLPPGTVVETIDGKPAREVLDGHGAASWDEGGFFSSPQRARFWAWRTPLGSEKQGTRHRLRIRKGGRAVTVTLVNRVPGFGWPRGYHPPAGLKPAGRNGAHGILQGKVGYLRLTRCRGDDLLKAVAVARKAHGDAVGWIVDLRGNTGGYYDGGKVRPAFAALPGKLAAIIDAGTISAGETLARDLVNHAEARLFGQPTAGSSGRKRRFELPGLCTVRYTVRSFGGLDGPIEGTGITPHVLLEADPADLAAGRNTEIEAARKWVLQEPIPEGGVLR